MSNSIPILLPPEPPRDRIIEAVGADGTIKFRAGFRYGFWRPWYSRPSHWFEIVMYAMDPKYGGREGWQLRHVPTFAGWDEPIGIWPGTEEAQ